MNRPSKVYFARCQDVGRFWARCGYKAAMKFRKGVVWVLWGLAMVGLVFAPWLGWVEVPPWILVVFSLALLVFGLVWWAVSREKLLLGRR